MSLMRYLNPTSLTVDASDKTFVASKGCSATQVVGYEGPRDQMALDEDLIMRGSSNCFDEFASDPPTGLLGV